MENTTETIKLSDYNWVSFKQYGKVFIRPLNKLQECVPNLLHQVNEAHAQYEEFANNNTFEAIGIEPGLKIDGKDLEFSHKSMGVIPGFYMNFCQIIRYKSKPMEHTESAEQAAAPTVDQKLLIEIFHNYDFLAALHEGKGLIQTHLDLMQQAFIAGQKEQQSAYIQELEATNEHLEKENILLKAEKEADRWISVNERLPENGERVLVFTYLKSRMCAALSYDETKATMWKTDIGDRALEYVTHWAKLPLPPK